ncbi:hypothetical protein TNCV_5010321 [Trichonephila clavipes]|nr:hypothetical protein TNCV_5010321 [Trichonephila clavipes]
MSQFDELVRERQMSSRFQPSRPGLENSIFPCPLSNRDMMATKHLPLFFYGFSSVLGLIQIPNCDGTAMKRCGWVKSQWARCLSAHLASFLPAYIFCGAFVPSRISCNLVGVLMSASERDTGMFEDSFHICAICVFSSRA